MSATTTTTTDQLAELRAELAAVRDQLGQIAAPVMLVLMFVNRCQLAADRIGAWWRTHRPRALWGSARAWVRCQAHRLGTARAPGTSPDHPPRSTRTPRCLR